LLIKAVRYRDKDIAMPPKKKVSTIPPQSPTPVRVLSASGAAGAKANFCTNGPYQLALLRNSRIFFASSPVRLARTRMWSMATSHCARL
jgi:hypothetical protein